MKQIFLGLAFLFLSLQQALNAQENEPPQSDENAVDAESLLRARSIRASLASDGSRVPLVKSPVLRFSDPARENDAGSLWVWGKTGRPRMIVEIYHGVSDPQNIIWVHAMSLTSTELVQADTDGGRWTPRTASFELQEIPDTRPPSDKALVRLRQMKASVQQAGFRSRTLIVVTTLLDAEEYTANDLAELYRARWNNELDLRSLKISLQMDVLRCKSPELVHKEIWTHILAYNLIRTIMAQSAARHGIEPRTISFKGAQQTLEAFQPLIAFQGQRGTAFRQQIYEQLLAAIAVHRVGNRPDRVEPRKRKRRAKKYDKLMKPRQELKRQMLKGVSNI